MGAAFIATEERMRRDRWARGARGPRPHRAGAGRACVRARDASVRERGGEERRARRRPPGGRRGAAPAPDGEPARGEAAGDSDIGDSDGAPGRPRGRGAGRGVGGG